MYGIQCSKKMQGVKIKLPYPTPYVNNVSEFGKIKVDGAVKHITILMLPQERAIVKVNAVDKDGLSFFKEFNCNTMINCVYSMTSVEYTFQHEKDEETEWYPITSRMVRYMIA